MHYYGVLCVSYCVNRIILGEYETSPHRGSIQVQSSALEA